MAKHLVQRVLEDIGSFEIRAYSGRGMYGQECLAVELDEGLGALMSDLILATEDLSGREIEDLAQAVRGVRTDSMGRGQIAYFPDVPFTATDVDDAPDYAEMHDEGLKQLASYGKTPEVRAAAMAELVRRDAE